MQPPSISLNFNLAKFLLFLIPNGYVPPYYNIFTDQGTAASRVFFRIVA